MRFLVRAGAIVAAAVLAAAPPRPWPGPGRGRKARSSFLRRAGLYRRAHPLAATADIRSWSSLYAEYGLTDRLTLGLDAGLGQGQDERVEAALVFARLPVWSPGEHRVAVDLGLGTLAATGEGAPDPAPRRPRLGPRPRRGSVGWRLARDGEFTRVGDPAGEVAVKADFTAGWSPTTAGWRSPRCRPAIIPTPAASRGWRRSVVRRTSARSHLQLGASAEVAESEGLVRARRWVELEARQGRVSGRAASAKPGRSAPSGRKRGVTSWTAMLSTRTTPLSGPVRSRPTWA